MKIDEKKFKAFKEFLVRYNPEPETADAMADFLEKWIEYRMILKRGMEEQYRQSVNAQFLALMEKNFKKP